MRGFTSSWSVSSTSMTQAWTASPSWGAARPTPGAARIVWARSSSSSCRYLPKLSTGSPLRRRRGSPRVMMGWTVIGCGLWRLEQTFGIHVDRPRHTGVAAKQAERVAAAQHEVETPLAGTTRDVGGQWTQHLDFTA